MRSRTWKTALVAVAAVVVPSQGEAQDGALNDAQIAHIAVTANGIDVELARLALERGRDAGVRSFAERMITDHTAVNEAAGALAARLGVTPADNAVSRSLLEGAAAARAELERLRGRAFDQGYAQREVEYHRAVLEALDTALIPGTRNAELKALLEQARGAIAAHLSHAEELAASFRGDR